MGKARVLEWHRKVNVIESKSTMRDLREAPIYNVGEVANYIGLPHSTLRSWIRGRSYQTQSGERFFAPLIEPANPSKSLLSFANLTEAHILRSTRDVNISIPKIRDAIDYIEKAFPSQHPLITEQFRHDGVDLFVERLGGNQIIAVSRHGQLGLKTILDQYLQRIGRDALGLPICVFPMRYEEIAIDLNVSSGRPTLKGTGILASMVYSLAQSGEGIEDLARDYKVTHGAIKEAVKYVESKRMSRN